MTKILIFFLFIFSALSLEAQTFTIRGKVTDLANGNPVEGAIVFIRSNIIDYTDREGNFKIPDIPAGEYVLKVSRMGFLSIERKIVLKNEDAILDFKLESSAIELDEIIIAADRTNNYLRNSSYSEHLIESSEIQSKPFNSLADVMQTQPGISLLRDGVWGTEVNIRGLSRENVVTLIDGNRIVTSTDIAARLALVDQNDIERIEIIKGASSSIYGSGATGGIINVVTRSPRFNSNYYFDGSISGGYNSVNNSSVTSGIFYSGDEVWAAKIAASYRKAGNIQTPAGELLNSQFNDYSLSGSLYFSPLRNHKLKIDYQKFKAEDVGIPGGSVFPGNAKVRYPDEERELMSAAYEIQNISKSLYKISIKYANQFIERNVENIPYITRNFPATPTTPARRVSVLKITPGAEHRSNNLDIQGNLLLAENNNLVFGIDYWDRSYLGHRENYSLIEILNSENIPVTVNNRILGEKPLPDAKSNNIGVYLQDETVLVNNKLSLSAGIRADRIFIKGEETRNPVYESINGVLNPNLKDSVIWNKFENSDYSYSSNLGLRYSVDYNLDLTLSLGLSFRSPSLEERFQYIDQGNFIRLGNPGLKSEIGKAVDFGFRFYSSELKIISSIFFNYFTDLVVEESGIYQERPAFIKKNIGSARIYGLDLGTEYNFYKTFIFYASTSYIKGDDLTFSSDLPGIPPLNALIGTKMSFVKNSEIDISSSLFAEQNKIASGEIKTPGYILFNLSYNYSPLVISGIALSFYSGIENIFNTKYRNHLSTTRGSLNLEPGRNIYLRIAVKW